MKVDFTILLGNLVFMLTIWFWSNFSLEQKWPSSLEQKKPPPSLSTSSEKQATRYLINALLCYQSCLLNDFLVGRHPQLFYTSVQFLTNCTYTQALEQNISTFYCSLYRLNGSFMWTAASPYKSAYVMYVYYFTLQDCGSK